MAYKIKSKKQRIDRFHPINESKRYSMRVTKRKKPVDDYKYNYAVKDNKTGYWVVGGISRTKESAISDARDSVL